jgi:hypothetical protein
VHCFKNVQNDNCHVCVRNSGALNGTGISMELTGYRKQIKKEIEISGKI